MTSSLSQSEVNKFEHIAEDWWNPKGNFRPLHELNPTRIEYIIKQVNANFQGIKGLEILDIGCGGGLVAEPLARLEANVTAIDASQINIDIAKLHAEKNNLKIKYLSSLAENLAESGAKYQLVLALEIIEHVNDVSFFVKTCEKLVKPGGVLIFSTINKTVKSFLQTIIAAEYLLKWLPIGTHNWSHFLKPSDIDGFIENMQLQDLTGLAYNPLFKTWSLSQDIGNNYFMTFRRK